MNVSIVSAKYTPDMCLFALMIVIFIGPIRKRFQFDIWLPIVLFLTACGMVTGVYQMGDP